METLVIQIPKKNQRKAIALLAKEFGGNSHQMTQEEGDDLALALRMKDAMKSGVASTEEVLKKLDLT